jgi:hypothetical protein
LARVHRLVTFDGCSLDILELVEGKFHNLAVQERGILSVKNFIRNIMSEFERDN